MTIFADASFDRVTGIGAWGMWAKSTRGTIEASAAFRDNPEHSVDAETKAIVNAVKVALKSGVAQQSDKLLIQSDCTSAIAILSGTPKIGKKGYNMRRLHRRHALLRLAFGSAAEGCTIEFRHVPGHKGKTSPRAAINTLVDKAARKIVKAAKKAAAA